MTLKTILHSLIILIAVIFLLQTDYLKNFIWAATDLFIDFKIPLEWLRCNSLGVNLLTLETLNCGERTTNHTTDACIIQDFDVFKQRFAGVPDLEAFETHLFEQYGNNIYTILYAGMGCHLYVRHKDGIIKALFMHQDSWGQYGPTADDTPRMNKFIENCGEVDKLDFQPTLHSLPPSPVEDSSDRVIQCPICRTDNKMSSIKPVYGTEEKCKICFDENVTKFFGECGHLVSCNGCFESL